MTFALLNNSTAWNQNKSNGLSSGNQPEKEAAKEIGLPL